MSIGRLLLALLVLGLGVWLFKFSGLLAPKPGEDLPSAPIERAREVAREKDRLNAETERLRQEADSTDAGGRIRENMTLEQVRAVLGSPDETTVETLASGIERQTWTYRSVGKTVIFENGIAVRIE